jgi:hypothetical protein
MVPRKRVLLLTASTPKVKGKVLLAGSSKIDFEKLENIAELKFFRMLLFITPYLSRHAAEL